MKVLVMNCGSTSLKFELVDLDADRPLWGGELTGVGTQDATLSRGPRGRRTSGRVRAPDLMAALRLVLDEVARSPEMAGSIDAVAHRIGHGGLRYRQAVEIDSDVKAEIARLIPLVPLHHPAMLAGIAAAEKLLPGVPQVAVFDTAFHGDIPEHAAIYGIPRSWFDRGVRKFGFHGHAHQFATLQAASMLEKPADELRLVTCHLGGGASVSAIANGRSLDNSLGFSSLPGLLMGTRCGDIDPGILVYLMQERGLTLEQVQQILSRQGGLLGISGLSADMRELERAADAGHDGAQLAIRAFCYRVRLYIGAYLAVLGGAQAIVFSGGIGTNSARVRSGCLQGLQALGFALDERANLACRVDENSPVAAIDDGRSPGRILVVAVDEELMMARQCAQALGWADG